ncbi:MAG: tRNA (adenosine(37)-N6)-threonylcarbamoyltransferase complex dimerization subunit type 1 TsaB [Legionella sp. 40-6]|nr:tRNA (adenosine(37)-N6)-threonylcarbamoyltransferase complex dimerization subunit type 1 TsaB [Legionella sp.]OJY39725.1 MAG: tRNA (adenosine(37)-N6)-threonylcarbamoyltransferase complex dimerization subunit type 1 TsaB [Legionella sp. 40-6]
MNLLAIDTSTEHASIALTCNGEVIEKTQDNQKTHAQFLLPIIDSLLAECGIGISQLDAIAFGCGPGSFTGLRIACSTAKGLAFAHDLPLIPISTLAAVAWTARQQIELEFPVLAILDARMNEFYWAYYSGSSYNAEPQVSAVESIIVHSTDPFILAGTGIVVCNDNLAPTLKPYVRHQIATFPKASAMLHLAVMEEFPAVNAAEAKPVYVRNKVTYDKK